MNRTALSAGLSLVLAFGLGVGAGLAWARRWAPPPPSALQGLEPLELTRAQQQAIESIIENHRDAVVSALAPCQPGLDDAQRQVTAEIEAHLQPSQREAFAALRAKRGPPLPP